MQLTIDEVSDPAACFALRQAVFVKEQEFRVAEEFDDLDATARHLLACDGTTPVATARLMIEGNTGRIGRICVVKPYRGQGVGAVLVRDALDRLRATPGVHRAVLGAQVRAAGFYTALGFSVCGPLYDDGGVPHHDMEIAL
ncbi:MULTISPECIES: GNAT family N-acetyltransferase [unclassified Meridianimarinicoccus]|uniref:GNAT family N-acetyltransferase n=1 Tax=unclassified Meridianimarinicoccus TaxID=2923344 RepID=UPI001867F90F|nr:GNAT family N-acetyltransferase [Fluviibacterium sp. MJW13]